MKTQTAQLLLHYWHLEKHPPYLKSEKTPGHFWLANCSGCHGDPSVVCVCSKNLENVCVCVCVCVCACARCSAYMPSEPFILLWHPVSGCAWPHISVDFSPMILQVLPLWLKGVQFFNQAPPPKTVEVDGFTSGCMEPQSVRYYINKNDIFKWIMIWINCVKCRNEPRLCWGND